MTNKESLAGFAEDMPSLIRSAVALAGTTCGNCAAFHGTWPASRLARATGGVDADRDVLVRLFGKLGAGGPAGRWLIAGAADTGILATVAASLGQAAGSFRFTVIDLCQTPLALCRDYAERTGLKLDLGRSDILDFTPQQKQQLVFAHSVLRHMPKERRADAVARFHDWLAPGGVLVNVTSVDGEPAPDPAAADASIGKLLAACRSVGIEDAPTLRRLEAWRRERFADRAGGNRAIPEEGELERLCAAAGFARIDRVEASSSRPHRRPHEIVVAAKAG